MGGWVLFLSCVFNAALVYQTLQDLSKSIMPIFVDVDLRAFTKHCETMKNYEKTRVPPVRNFNDMFYLGLMTVNSQRLPFESYNAFCDVKTF